MTVLVTGAGGAVGTVLCEDLERRGLRVVKMLHSRSAGGGGLVADITDSSAIAEVVESVQPHSVVHLAGMTGHACDANPGNAHSVNVGGTANLLAAARRVGVARFVFASTAAVYGTSRILPVAETDDLAPASEYARTKIAAEELVRAAAINGMSAVILRLFNIWGIGFPHSLVARLDRSTPREPVTLRGPDEFVRDYIHRDDVAEAIFHALSEASSEQHLTINVGSGVPMSNRRLAERMGTASDCLTFAPSRYDYSVADISCARERWGFHPVRLPGRSDDEGGEC